MASRAEIERLKREHGRRLLRLDGVCGVGVEREGGGEDSYVLVVHVDRDDPAVRAEAVRGLEGQPVRVVHSGPFRKQ